MKFTQYKAHIVSNCVIVYKVPILQYIFMRISNLFIIIIVCFGLYFLKYIETIPVSLIL